MAEEDKNDASADGEADRDKDKRGIPATFAAFFWSKCSELFAIVDDEADITVSTLTPALIEREYQFSPRTSSNAGVRTHDGQTEVVCGGAEVIDLSRIPTAETVHFAMLSFCRCLSFRCKPLARRGRHDDVQVDDAADGEEDGGATTTLTGGKGTGISPLMREKLDAIAVEDHESSGACSRSSTCFGHIVVAQSTSTRTVVVDVL
jgi:hypothetical protein